MINFRKNILDAIVSDLKAEPQTVALWEGGSAANGTSDQYSDVDITLIAFDSVETVFEIIEKTLNRVSRIKHCFIEPKQFLPGYFQRVYLIENSPRFFFVDVGVMLKSSDDVFAEFFQIERHGKLIVHFDKLNLVKSVNADPAFFKGKHLKRLSEIEAAYPIYRIEVLKELERGHSIDAYSFYFLGLIRPLVEILGMIHRPFKFDFGLRYLYSEFPETDRKVIEDLIYVKSENDLKVRVDRVDLLFYEVVARARKSLALQIEL